MPFDADEVRYDLVCGPGPDGRWQGSCRIEVEAAALRRLGLHPAQPTSTISGATAPEWWRRSHRPATGG